MKRGLLFVGLISILLATGLFAEGKPWFDMGNCDFCMNLLDDPKLMDNMTTEVYEISSGILLSTIVESDFQESYLKAQKAMEAVGMEMMNGKKDVKMCGYCERYGELMQLGAKFEHVNVDVANLVLISSADPDVQKSIWEFGTRTHDEMAKMNEADKK